MLERLWESNGFQLLFGMFGIYTCYWISGYFQEKTSKQPYQITNIIDSELFMSPVAVLYIPCTVSWIIGFLGNNLFYKEHTKMPAPNLIACAIMVCISTHTYMLAVYFTSFPIVMLIKSCNIVSVVVVGVFCSRVRDKSLALGPKKILVASLISLGIILYNFGGDTRHQEKATDVLGLTLLFISLIADGFLPDFQAVIKTQYQPRPLEMFEHVNKWVAIISTFYATISGQLAYGFQFKSRHPQVFHDLLMIAFLTTAGQIFIYRMIKQFKQHIVPFVITTRKIFTVVLSIFIFKHHTTVIQILAIALIFITASSEYITEIYNSKKKPILQKIPDETEQMMREEVQTEQQTTNSIIK